mmetsp:Transcript_82051/g.232320  ORF Transcript_82051/g.232320 Transcript_82051/m.232320 type:complete len:376 (-) Transcript_82051:158-1285(-)
MHLCPYQAENGRHQHKRKAQVEQEAVYVRGAAGARLAAPVAEGPVLAEVAHDHLAAGVEPVVRSRSSVRAPAASMDEPVPEAYDRHAEERELPVGVVQRRVGQGLDGGRPRVRRRYEREHHGEGDAHPVGKHVHGERHEERGRGGHYLEVQYEEVNDVPWIPLPPKDDVDAVFKPSVLAGAPHGRDLHLADAGPFSVGEVVGAPVVAQALARRPRPHPAAGLGEAPAPLTPEAGLHQRHVPRLAQRGHAFHVRAGQPDLDVLEVEGEILGIHAPAGKCAHEVKLLREPRHIRAIVKHLVQDLRQVVYGLCLRLAVRDDDPGVEEAHASLAVSQGPDQLKFTVFSVVDVVHPWAHLRIQPVQVDHEVCVKREILNI